MTPKRFPLANTHMIKRYALAIITLVVALCSTTLARAQSRMFYLDRLDIGGAPNDGIATWRPRMHERTVLYGQFALGYSLHPLRGDISTPDRGVRDPNDAPNPVSNQLINYLSVGTEIMERVGVGVTLPIVLYQNGESPCPRGTAGCNSSDPAHTVASDMRLDLRTILYRDDNRRFHFGLFGSLYPSTGDRYSFTSDDQTHGAVRALVEFDWRSFILDLNTGVHFRPERGFNQIGVGNEWVWAAGGFFPLREGKARIGLQVFGSTGLGSVTLPNSNTEVKTTFTRRNTPVEWMAEARFALDKGKWAWASFGGGTRLTSGYGAPDMRVVATIGYAFPIKDTDPGSPGRRYKFQKDMEPKSGDADKDGIPDDVDLCPTVPEDGQPPDATDGCPAPPDRDHDGIPDDSDKCPDQAEDMDGLDDIDGCPEDDYDHDGVPDVNDKCPREPGNPSPEPDKNGCPQFIRHVEGSSEIQILKRIEFATASAQILPKSYPILDEVIKLLQVHTDIERVSVEGHTDSRGGHDMNMKLSQSRAESVVRYISTHGIAGSRLEAHGYGPDKPIDSNDTDEGRQRNRRVEFHIKSKK